MLLGFTVTVVAACFCVSAPIHAAGPASGIPEPCLGTARAWSHLGATYPRIPVPADPFIHVGARPLLLSLVR